MHDFSVILHDQLVRCSVPQQEAQNGITGSGDIRAVATIVALLGWMR